MVVILQDQQGNSHESRWTKTTWECFDCLTMEPDRVQLKYQAKTWPKKDIPNVHELSK